MDKFKCRVCGTVYTDEEAERRDVSFYVPYGEGSVLKGEYESVCPHCGASIDDSSEGEECSVCGEFSEDCEEIDGAFVCPDCIAKAQKRLIDIVEKEFDSAEIEILKDCGILDFEGVA